MSTLDLQAYHMFLTGTTLEKRCPYLALWLQNPKVQNSPKALNNVVWAQKP